MKITVSDQFGVDRDVGSNQRRAGSAFGNIRKQIQLGSMRWIDRGNGNTVLGRIDRYLKNYEYLIHLGEDTYTVRKIRC